MIFISHATKDDGFVNQLADELAIYGFSTWVDHRDMPPGSRWVANLEKALHGCDVMILVCSSESMASSYVEAEWHTYFDMKKPVIPVVIDNCNTPPFLRTLHQLNFQDMSKFRTNMESLVNILKVTDERTIPNRVSNKLTREVSVLEDENAVLDKVQYLLDEVAPTYRSGMMHIIVPNDELIMGFPLVEELVVGRKSRKAENDLMVNLACSNFGGMISRQHAMLRYTGGQLYVRDCGSTNGTYLNGDKLRPDTDYPLENYALVYFSKSIPAVIRYQP